MRAQTKRDVKRLRSEVREAFSSAGSGLHRKICHVLGGTFDLPHAQTHAAVQPYVLAYNAPAVSESAGPSWSFIRPPRQLQQLRAANRENGRPRPGD